MRYYEIDITKYIACEHCLEIKGGRLICPKSKYMHMGRIIHEPTIGILNATTR